ncbi:MutS-related protein [Myroides pelagicus]|nr:AAA family ATPase [Myroides pelagicus]MEC4114673.1 AAA family ATPase [Myroides pelagicus]
MIPIFSINLYLHFRNKYAQYNLLDATNNFKLVHKAYSEIEKLNELRNLIEKETTVDEKNKIKKLYFLTHFFSAENIVKDDITTLVFFPLELLKILFNIEVITLELFAKLSVSIKDILKKNFEIIAKVDITIAIADLQVENTLCKPTFIKNKEIHISEIIHPLITNCIHNDLNLTNKSLLLTGSNMAGKTTFIRTFTINAILAQTLGFVFAKKYEAPFSKINTSIRITDNLEDNTSYYLKEVKRLKEFIQQAETNSPYILVLDEILKGTNTIERIASSYAILKYLNDTNSIVLVFTYDLELIDLLEKENYQCQFLQENIVNNQLHFDYKLQLGKIKTTNAITILELQKFPKLITDLAHTTKKSFS